MTDERVAPADFEAATIALLGYDWVQQFKKAAQLEGLDLQEALDQAMSNWMESVFVRGAEQQK